MSTVQTTAPQPLAAAAEAAPTMAHADGDGRWAFLPGGPALAVAFGAVAVTLATALPLATWALALTLFGLWHVLAELRFVADRYGVALGGALGGALFGGLAAVVGLRLLAMTGAVERWPWGLGALELELAVVVGLTAVGAALARRLGRGAVLAAVAGAAIAAGLAGAPRWTILTLAALHNVTPLGFLADALPTHERRAGLALAAALMLGLPALVATGAPSVALAALGLAWPELSPLAIDGLDAAIDTVLPRGWLSSDAEQHAFSALLVAQLLHYGAVIHVLPQLGQAVADTPRLTAPLAGGPAKALAAVAIVGLAGVFVADFGEGRAVYSLAAAVHAWLEVPLLLALLAPRLQR